MSRKTGYIAVFLFGVLLFFPHTGFTSIPPVGTATLDLVKKDKPKFRPACYSTFMTFNVENIQFHRTDPFFHYQNLAYGLKIGTMRNAGWYLSVMSNFNFNGFLTPVDNQQVNTSVNSKQSYFDGLLGLTFRYCKPLSFHLGVGYHYKTTNYKTSSGNWGHLPIEDVHGPMAAAGFMFHISGFVLSAEAVANYNLKAPDFKDGLGVGFKVGIGFCVENKNSAKKTKSKTNKRISDKMPASELHFIPTTAGPDEYDVVFRHSYTKPKQELMMIIETDTLLSKLPQPEYFNNSRYEEESIEAEKASVTENVKPVVQQQEPIITKQEEVIPQKSEVVSVSESDKSTDVQPEKSENQSEKQTENLPEKQSENQPEKQTENLPEKQSENQPEKQTESQIEQKAQSIPQKPEPIQKVSLEIEEVSDTLVMSSTPIPPCTELTVKDIDGNSYHTLSIGNQCWLRENMRVTRFANGDSILLGKSFDFKHAVCYYPGGDSSKVSTYGYLYNWNAVNHVALNNGNHQVQGVCPVGWHIPSMTEWEMLFGYLATQSTMSCQGNPQNVAKALASKTDWTSSEVDCAIGNQISLNNNSGFNALPAGIFVGKFDFFGKVARFWSSSVSQAQGKCDVFMSWDDAVVKKSDQEPAVVGFSVRCLKN